jgi:hypothetical protein
VCLGWFRPVNRVGACRNLRQGSGVHTHRQAVAGPVCRCIVMCAVINVSNGMDAPFTYRVRRLMKQQGLRSRWKRKFVHTTDSRHDLPVAANVLDRSFDPSAPNQAWVADISVPQQAA